MSKGTVLISVVVLALAAGPAVRGQDPAAATSVGVAQDDDTLRDIAVSLRQLVKQQRVLLAIRRIELAEGRLAPQQEELRRAREEARSQNAEIERMLGIAESFRAEVEEAIRLGAAPPSGARSELERVEAMVALERERLEATERRVIEIENDIARDRRRIENLDDRLEELLSALEPR